MPEREVRWREEFKLGRASTRNKANNTTLVLTGATSSKGVLAALNCCLRFGSKAHRFASGTRLLAIAKRALVDRRLDLLEGVSNFTLASLPETDFARTARYYAAFCLHRRGRTEQARKEFEIAIENLDPARRPAALLTLSLTYLETGEAAEFAATAQEAAALACHTDPLSHVQALRNIAISRALLGDHKASLSMLQSQLPVMRGIGYWYPVDLLNHLNSIAIELGEVGRVDEANSTVDYLLHTAYAKYQPEWHDTKLELATKPRRVFPPITLALGAPADDLIVAEPELCGAARALDAERDSLSPPARACQAATRSQQAVKQQIAQGSWLPTWRPTASIRVAHKASTVPGLARSGYAVSPPARAPPLT